MGKRDARQFQHAADINKQRWNIVELESRRQLRRKVNELIELVDDPTITSSDMREQLLLGVATFGEQFAMQLVRSLHRDDQHERQSIIWLLTLLDDQTTIPLLKQMSRDERQSRSIRLSAALALAGMGATAEMIDDDTWHKRLYATG
jgi:HEAT repeat protein